MPAIDPTGFSVGGADWNVSLNDTQTTGQTQGTGFGHMLGGAIQSLSDSQTQAAQASQDLATGKATDPTSVVMAVERAQLAMQLASQIRTKAVEAAQTIFQTQV